MEYFAIVEHTTDYYGVIDALYITHILASVANLLNLNPEINIPGTNLAETVVVKNDFLCIF